MRVKTYRGKNTQSVLARIKAELGPEAVILSTRNHNDNGSKTCEITAALDQSPATPASAARTARETDLDIETLRVPGWGQWQHEWLRIKDHFTALLKPQMDFARLRPRQRLALEFLEREGASPEVILDIYRALLDEPEMSVLTPLEKMVRVRPFVSSKWPNKFHALAGPHGVGKTSVLVRMALAAKREQEDARICLVNTDHRRSTGKMALQHYAQLSGFHYRDVSDPAELEKLVDESGQFDKIFIDMPGLDKGISLEQFCGKSRLSDLEDLCVHLLLSPHYAPAQLAAFQRQYFSCLVCGLVWTKLDEACDFGSLVNVAVATGLPISALAFGPGLGDLDTRVRHSAVWRMLFKHQLPNETEQAA